MIVLQIIATAFAITNIWLLADGSVWLGCAIGVPGQFIWLYIFYKKRLKILMVTDIILLWIYTSKLYELSN